VSNTRAAGFDRLPFFFYFLSGTTALVYETVWIRLFSATFGNTAQALATVIAVFLGGLAIGSILSGRLKISGLKIYGSIEALVGAYALATPWLIHAAQPALASVYQSNTNLLPLARAVFCALILLPATILMGATLPVIAAWLDNGRRTSFVYSVNVAGACAGALLTGFVLLPGLGYHGTLLAAAIVNLGIGVACFAVRFTALRENPLPHGRDSEARLIAPLGVLAFLSGWITLSGEVAWTRLFGLLFGFTASTLTLVLTMFLAGLAGGAVIASFLRERPLRWLAGSQFASLGLLVSGSFIAAHSVEWIAETVRAHNSDPSRIELAKLQLLALTVLPLALAAGLTFPLLIRAGGGRVGWLYGMNILGSIAGSLMAGWLLIPLVGTQNALAAGAAGSVLAGCIVLWSSKSRWLALAGGVGVLVLSVFPRWNIAQITAGAYKYALYYEGSVASALAESEVEFLKEGVTATVSVRRQRGARTLAIDGKIDASDTGSDLLTEKLLAHLPLLLKPQTKQMCIIGLASGVTAGAALTWPLERLDIAEVSPEVVEASHLFDGVNGKPLADARTRLLVADGRNHLALTRETYDLIVSEPSNPWIAGMNGMFTTEFFATAKARLRPGGLMAQWFHIYNLPEADLRSLLAAFHAVFPNAALWQLNDGDMLMTGSDAAPAPLVMPLPLRARKDLADAGVPDASLLWQLYRMGGEDLRRFVSGSEMNTDDRPLLEFHGQQNLHLQTDAANVSALEKAATAAPIVSRETAHARLAASGALFEKAESPRLAFGYYDAAMAAGSEDVATIAGLDRTAVTPAQTARAAAVLGLGSDARTLDSRTVAAAEKASAGDLSGARLLLEEATLVYPQDPRAHFNFGVFWIQHGQTIPAIEQFAAAAGVDPRYVPALEILIQIYTARNDKANAVAWSQKLLAVNPQHAGAQQTLARFGAR
jgi:spermidine synthase